MLRKIVTQTVGSVFQIDLRSDPPVVSGRRPMRNMYETPAIPVFVITDAGPGLLVRNPSAPELLTQGDIPSGLAALMKEKLAEKPTVLNLKGIAPVKTVAQRRAEIAAAAAPPRKTLAQRREELAALAAEPAPTQKKTLAQRREELAALAAEPAPEALSPQRLPRTLPPLVQPQPLEQVALPLPVAPTTQAAAPTTKLIIPPAPDPFSLPTTRGPPTAPPTLNPVQPIQAPAEILQPSVAAASPTAVTPRSQWEAPPRPPQPQPQPPAVEAVPEDSDEEDGVEFENVSTDSPGPEPEPASLIPPPPMIAPPEGIRQFAPPGSRLPPLEGAPAKAPGKSWLNNSE